MSYRLQASTRDDLGAEPGLNVLVSIFSHELRNCLGAIRNATGIRRFEKSTSCVGGRARVLIERQVAQMTVLIEDLRQLTQSQQLHLRCEQHNLCTLAAQFSQSVEFTMQRRNHRMTTSFPDAPVWVRADAARLEQIFVNLLCNAAKYTSPGGDIRLSVQREEGEAVVRVSDNGIGIEPDVLPRVFDLFVQGDPPVRCVDAGLGIGLAVVRDLVERHGGRVSAASAGLGRGSEFTVHLPLRGQA